MTDTPSPSTAPLLTPELADLPADLLEQAFTHRSLCARDIEHCETNERLEFLGDAVLELIISEHLFVKFPKLDEGTLTRYRSALVRTESIALVADELNLGEHLRMSVGEEQSGGQHSPSILANTFEAVIGALYLGKGYNACVSFIDSHLLPHFTDLIADHDAKDPKTLLQEKVQALGKPAPTYKTVRAEGPDHAKVFTVSVQVEGFEETTGQGASKQKAQQEAAEKAFKQYFSESA